MNESRSPRSQLYDGFVYGQVLDRLLAGLHAVVAREVPNGGRCLDACCGTGALALRLAPRSAEVWGVDLSPRQVAYAERRRRRRGVDNVRFRVGDVSHLADVGDRAFGTSTLVMALHEMPARARVPVLRELMRVSGELVVVDFRVPMPRNLAGWRNRFIEALAGREHFGAFRDFGRRGGLEALFAEAGVQPIRHRHLDSGTLQLAVLSQG